MRAGRRHAGLLAAVILVPGLAGAASAVSTGPCAAGEIACVRAEIERLLACHGRCRKNPKRCGDEQARCEARAVAKLGTGVRGGKGCLDRLATRGVCDAPIDPAVLDGQARAAVAAALAGVDGPPTATCGDGVVQGAEECDLGTLNGKTCASLGLFGTGLACGPGCVSDASACAPARFEDRGATVVDHQTGLEWEKKTDDGGVHDKDNVYTRADPTTFQAGTVYTWFLNLLPGTLNFHRGGFFDGGSSCGHCDWRIPTVVELRSINDPQHPHCLDPVFGPTAPHYWSSTSYDAQGALGWVVSFENCGEGVTTSLAGAYPVRAVRTYR